MRRKQLKALAQQMPHVQRIQTIPGIGILTATALVAFIGDAKRFPTLLLGGNSVLHPFDRLRNSTAVLRLLHPTRDPACEACIAIGDSLAKISTNVVRQNPQVAWVVCPDRPTNAAGLELKGQPERWFVRFSGDVCVPKHISHRDSRATRASDIDPIHNSTMTADLFTKPTTTPSAWTRDDSLHRTEPPGAMAL